MSEGTAGPGWRQATDGRWYPPPANVAPDPNPLVPPPGSGPPPGAPGRGASRTLIVLVVLVVLVAAGVVGVVVVRARTRPVASAAQLDDAMDPAIVLDLDYKLCFNGGGGDSCRHMQDLVFSALRSLHQDLPALGVPVPERQVLVDRTVGLSERIDDSYRTGAGSPTGLWADVESLLSDWADAAAARVTGGAHPQAAATPSTTARPPVSSLLPSAVTTTAPATDSDTGPVDFRNQSYPGDICPDGDPGTQIRVVDGEGAIAGPTPVTVSVVAAARGVITGLPGTDVALIAGCTAGAGASFTAVLIYPESDATRRLGLLRSPSITNADRAEVSAVTVADGVLHTTWSVWRPGDPGCCPTGTAAITYRWSGDGFTATGAPDPAAPTRGSHTYHTTHNVSLREGPSVSATARDQIPAGTAVVVECSQLGDTVSDVWGPDNHWDRVTFNGRTGFVTDEWLDTRSDVNDLSIIPSC